ncbi:MAG: hypothetical protein DRP82_01375, partial [Planctomycetota bacterium]
LKRLSQEEIWKKLCETVQRTKRITRVAKVREDEQPRPELLQHDAERFLYQRLLETKPRFNTLVQNAQFYEAAHLYHQAFTEAVHDFFDRVFVNVKEEEIKRNRVALCLAVHRLFASQIADLSVVEVEDDG